MNEKETCCQSCGMPLTTQDEHGTERDGTLSKDYCRHCYQHGSFTDGECTMGQMIETCIPFELQAGAFPDADSARKALSQLFPTLKRWKQPV